MTTAPATRAQVAISLTFTSGAALDVLSDKERHPASDTRDISWHSTKFRAIGFSHNGFPARRSQGVLFVKEGDWRCNSVDLGILNHFERRRTSEKLDDAPRSPSQDFLAQHHATNEWSF